MNMMSTEMKHIPQRTCIACRRKTEKHNLLRIVSDNTGNLTADTAQKMNGRGAYICNNMACLEKAVKTRAFERSLRRHLNTDAGSQLLNGLKNE